MKIKKHKNAIKVAKYDSQKAFKQDMNKTTSLLGPTVSIGRSDDGYEEEHLIEQNRKMFEAKMNSTIRVNEPEPFDAGSYTNNRSKFMNIAIRKKSVNVFSN